MAASPEKFVKPADLFKMRRSLKGSRPSETPIISQSPMKCLNNINEPSPVKNLPNLLKNPFNSAKRRLNLGACGGGGGGGSLGGASGNSSSNSPVKRMISGSCNYSSPRKSPTKRTRMLEMDEDANMEAPKFRKSNLLTPRKHSSQSSQQREPCYQNDWALRTKVRIKFAATCKNWSQDKATTHKRHSGTGVDEDTPSKVNDRSISIEAIKNAAVVYQHPYFSWLPLFPRCDNATMAVTQVEGSFSILKHSEVGKTMHRDWCESLNDLVNLLIDGKCPFFYLCSDIYTILFKSGDDSSARAYISPMSHGLRCVLRKLGINVIGDDDDDDVENSQTGPIGELVETLGPDEDEVKDDDEDATQILENLGVTVSRQDFPKQSKLKSLNDANSNTQSNKSTSQRPLATIEGVDDLRSLVKFLQTNRLYTISYKGQFACIPPTLLSPVEFRLSTPRRPEVSASAHAPRAPPTPPDDNEALSQKEDTSFGSELALTSSNVQEAGPKFIELKGIILPNLFRRLHKLLTVSDNIDHTCSASQLHPSLPFKTIRYSP